MHNCGRKTDFDVRNQLSEAVADLLCNIMKLFPTERLFFVSGSRQIITGGKCGGFQERLSRRRDGGRKTLRFCFAVSGTRQRCGFASPVRLCPNLYSYVYKQSFFLSLRHIFL